MDLNMAFTDPNIVVQAFTISATYHSLVSLRKLVNWTQVEYIKVAS